MIRFTLSLFISGVLLTGSAVADLTAYTSQSAFLSALPGSALLSGTDFESCTPGEIISDGNSIDGITFNFSFGGPEMKISDAYTTTSGSNFLGTTDFDVFVSGDGFSLGFGPQNAIGMHFITADNLVDNDISLDFGGITANLESLAIEDTLTDGSKVYFLGIINTDAMFTTATVNSNGNALFFYNVDDIQLAAIPEPASAALVTLCAVGLAMKRRRAG